MTIYRDETYFLVVLDPARAFLHRSDTGWTSAIADPQTLVAPCRDTVWAPSWHEPLPDSLLTALERAGATPVSKCPARVRVDPAGP